MKKVRITHIEVKGKKVSAKLLAELGKLGLITVFVEFKPANPISILAGTPPLVKPGVSVYQSQYGRFGASLFQTLYSQRVNLFNHRDSIFIRFWSNRVYIYISYGTSGDEGLFFVVPEDKFWKAFNELKSHSTRRRLLLIKSSLRPIFVQRPIQLERKVALELMGWKNASLT